MNQKNRLSSRSRRTQLLTAALLLAGLLLAGLFWLLATPAATGRTPSLSRPIPPESFVRVYNGPSAAGTPRPTPMPTVGLPEPTRPVIVVPTPEVIVVPRATGAPVAPTVADAKAYALAHLGPIQYRCLADIVAHEDRTWSPYDTNSSSGAYGIPQALPGSKMASAGSDWRWNRITQVRWMIGYVDVRYGSACAAAAFRSRAGWY